MNREALFSDGTGNYLVPSEPNEFDFVTIKFRTKKNDVELSNFQELKMYIIY